MPDAALLEQAIGMALLRRASRDDPTAILGDGGLRYHRSGTDAEIDFVGPHAPLPVEVKDGDDLRRSFQTIAASPWARGLLATRSRLERHAHGVVVPHALLLLLALEAS